MLWIVWYWEVKVENNTMDWGSGPEMLCQRDEGDWMRGQRGKGGVLYGFGALCRLYHSVFTRYLINGNRYMNSIFNFTYNIKISNSWFNHYHISSFFNII